MGYNDGEGSDTDVELGEDLPNELQVCLYQCRALLRKYRAFVEIYGSFADLIQTLRLARIFPMNSRYVCSNVGAM